MQKFRKKMQNLCEKWKLCKKQIFCKTYRIFKNKCKILAKKLRKRDLSASPINGLTQNINIDLKTTRRHQTIH